jgi:hypothetical protein
MRARRCRSCCLSRSVQHLGYALTRGCPKWSALDGEDGAWSVGLRTEGKSFLSPLTSRLPLHQSIEEFCGSGGEGSHHGIVGMHCRCGCHRVYDQNRLPMVEDQGRCHPKTRAGTRTTPPSFGNRCAQAPRRAEEIFVTEDIELQRKLRSALGSNSPTTSSHTENQSK